MDTSHTERLLGEIGLTPTETKLYLAGISGAPLSIQDLRERTNIKRPTIYHALSTLKEKRLVSERRTGRKTLYAMSSPEFIRSLVERDKEVLESRSKKLDELIPILAFSNDHAKKQAVSVVEYNGVEGMKMVFDMAFFCRSKRWDVLAPVENFLKEYDKEYAERYLKARTYHGITGRTLWEFRPKGRELNEDERVARDPRFMPVVMQGRFKSMMILFDDKIALFSSYEGLSAVLIQSKEFHGMFTALFDGLWEFSERY